MFDIQYRPSVNEWNDTINSLLSLKIILKFDNNSYKFNIVLRDGVNVSMEYVINVFKKAQRKNINKEFTASSSLQLIKSTRRPIMTFRNPYLEDMKCDNYIRLKRIAGSRKYYELI